MLGKLIYTNLGYESDSINLILEANKEIERLKLDVLNESQNKALIEKQEDIIKKQKQI